MSTEKRLMVLVTVLMVALIGAIAYQSLHIARLQKTIDGIQGPVIKVATGQQDEDQSQIKTSQGKTGPKQPASSFPSIAEDWDPFSLSSDDWNPFAEMRQMHERMDRMFDGAFQRFNASPSFGSMAGDLMFSPDIDLREEDDQYVARVDLPGMDRGEIDIQVENQTLKLSGTRENLTEEKEGDQFFRRERSSGHFERSIVLPGPVNAEDVHASYEEGVLTITMPKSEATESPIKVPIETDSDSPPS